MGTTLAIDATNNEEVYSLTRHIDQFNELLQMVFVRTKREVVPADAKTLPVPQQNLQVQRSSRFSKVLDRKSFMTKQNSALHMAGGDFAADQVSKAKRNSIVKIEEEGEVDGEGERKGPRIAIPLPPRKMVHCSLVITFLTIGKTCRESASRMTRCMKTLVVCQEF